MAHRCSRSIPLLALALALSATGPALAHHGFGLFQMQVFKDYSGTLTKLELVNPHSYLYFETVDADGKPLQMRCEMRAATLIRRSEGLSARLARRPNRRRCSARPRAT